jgi:hypothetical protein
MGRNDNVVADVLKGALAGGIATWVMGKVTSYMWEHGDPEARQRSVEVTQGQYVPDRAAQKAAALLRLGLDKHEEQKLAHTMHWGLGLTAGATYALLRRAVPQAAHAQGLLFGLGFWALVDEAATVLFGLAKPPQAYPWQDHVRGLVGHLAYGVVADSTLDLLDRAA